MLTVTFHGHACFLLEGGDGKPVMVDPFLTGKAFKRDVGSRAEVVILSPGHSHAFNIGTT